MKRLFGIIIIGISLFGYHTFAETACAKLGTCEVTTKVSVEITGGNICIGSSGVFNFGSFSVSSFTQIATGGFDTGYFFVDDMKGADNGYYTTIQMSGDMMQSGGAESIPSLNVFLKTNGPTPTLLEGQANPSVIFHPAATGFQSLDVARQLILRNSGPNNNIIGMYGTLPLMMLIIPAYQPIGQYIGTMVFTLYEN